MCVRGVQLVLLSVAIFSTKILQLTVTDGVTLS